MATTQLSNRPRSQQRNWSQAFAVMPIVFLANIAAAQFNSGSTGADGGLNLVNMGTIVFDPVALGIDADNDGIFHFTTVNIGPGVTVQLTVDKLGNRPVYWLASGNVQIDGVVDISGNAGYSAPAARVAAAPGPGGGAGGVGQASNGLPAQPGEGFGGGYGYGNSVCSSTLPGDASHASTGTFCSVPPYGNPFLSPLLGGSGGGGGAAAGSSGGGGGGAGGGALLIASSGTLTVSGAVLSNGGNGGAGSDGCNSQFPFGGGGSGGAIRLIASTVTGNGTLQANGGFRGAGCSSNVGSFGRIRIESYHQEFSGGASPALAFSAPNVIFPSANSPTVRVVSVAGVSVPPNPTGSFTVPDITISDGGSVSIEIEAHNIPLGTPVYLKLVPETGTLVEAVSAGLAGTFESSTATATATVPAGFSRFYVQANW